jgi:hypothetical protein
MFQENNAYRRTLNPRRRLVGVLLLACAALPLPALAQQGVEAFQPGYFAANQPATAADMVALLPGFHVQNGDSTVRGFSGTVGNVLIDGQMPTSKEESSSDLLSRIPASSVERIELIRGAAEMHGYTVLANVVRNRGASIRGHAEAEGGVTHFGTSEDKLALHLVRQGAESTLELSGSWGRDIGTQNQNGFGSRLRYLPSLVPVQSSLYDYPRLTNNAEASIAYRQPLLGGDLAVGAAYKHQRPYAGIVEHIYYPAIGLSTGLESNITDNAEARLDYRHGLGDYGQLQIFGVHRVIAQDETSQTDTAVETDVSHGLFNTREDVTRLAWNYQGAVKLEAGVEGSINVMTSHSSLILGPAVVALPAANIRLEEQRIEGFTSATYRFNPEWLMELGARYETSNLIQSGDSTLVRDLGFFKPRWLTTWNPGPGNEFRFLIEREVGQLVFRDFAASTSLNQNTVTAGNKNLEPARAWNTSLAWEAQVLGKGSLVIEAKREMISHVYDKVPIFSGGKVFSAAGNIGYGFRDGVQVNFIGSMDAIGLPALTLNIEADWHHSHVRDPATGQKRQINGGQTGGAQVFQLNTVDTITYDIPTEKLRLGMDFHNHGNSQERDFRVDEIDDTTHGFKLGFFVDYKPTSDWTIRLFDRDAFQTAAIRDRTVYSGLRGTAPISFLERRQLSNGSVFGLDIQHDI